MMIRTLRLSLGVLAVILLTADRARAMGEILGQTKDELKLKYDVLVHDPANGQVAVEFTLVDEGRLKPLDAVELMIPRNDGSGSYDLTAPLALRQARGKGQAMFHLNTEWAARAEIWLTTYSFDGKQLVMTRYHHVIPIANYMKKPTAAAANPAPAPAAEPPPAAPPTTERK